MSDYLLEIKGRFDPGNPPRIRASEELLDFGSNLPNEYPVRTFTLQNVGGPFSGSLRIERGDSERRFIGWFEETSTFPVQVRVQFHPYVQSMADLTLHEDTLVIHAGSQVIRVRLRSHIRPFPTPEPAEQTDYEYSQTYSSSSTASNPWVDIAVALGVFTLLVILFPIYAPMWLFWYLIGSPIYRLTQWLFGKEWPSELASNVSYAFTRLRWRLRRPKHDRESI